MEKTERHKFASLEMNQTNKTLVWSHTFRKEKTCRFFSPIPLQSLLGIASPRLHFPISRIRNLYWHNSPLSSGNRTPWELSNTASRNAKDVSGSLSSWQATSLAWAANEHLLMEASKLRKQMSSQGAYKKKTPLTPTHFLSDHY